MLFYLDESVVDAAETNKEVYNKLKELYYCWSHGLCIVSSSKKNFLRLVKIPGLEEYGYIQKQYKEFKGFMQRSPSLLFYTITKRKVTL